jgi:hypothetical protein
MQFREKRNGEKLIQNTKYKIQKIKDKRQKTKTPYTVSL